MTGEGAPHEFHKKETDTREAGPFGKLIRRLRLKGLIERLSRLDGKNENAPERT